jgi:ketosteroid isomerase-like protein
MKRIALLLALLPALWLGAPAHAQTLSPSETVDAFHFALKAGDRKKALDLLTSDLLVFDQGRIEHSRTDYARTHLADDIGFASTTTRTVARRSAKVQGNMAWVMSVNRNRGRFNNRTVDFTTDETVILTRVGGKWRIAHIHWSFNDEATH